MKLTWSNIGFQLNSTDRCVHVGRGPPVPFVNTHYTPYPKFISPPELFDEWHEPNAVNSYKLDSEPNFSLRGKTQALDVKIHTAQCGCASTYTSVCYFQSNFMLSLSTQTQHMPRKPSTTPPVIHWTGAPLSSFSPRNLQQNSCLTTLDYSTLLRFALPNEAWWDQTRPEFETKISDQPAVPLWVGWRPSGAGW